MWKVHKVVKSKWRQKFKSLHVLSLIWVIFSNPNISTGNTRKMSLHCIIFFLICRDYLFKLIANIWFLISIHLARHIFPYLKPSYWMINEVRNISIVTSINSKWTVSVIVVEIKKVGTSNCIIILSPFFCFYICYHLWKFIRKYELQCITTYINKIFYLWPISLLIWKTGH